MLRRRIQHKQKKRKQRAYCGVSEVLIHSKSVAIQMTKSPQINTMVTVGMAQLPATLMP